MRRSRSGLHSGTGTRPPHAQSPCRGGVASCPPRTEDVKPYLIFEVLHPGTLVLRRLHHTVQDHFFPYNPAEVWRILRR